MRLATESAAVQAPLAITQDPWVRYLRFPPRALGAAPRSSCKELLTRVKSSSKLSTRMEEAAEEGAEVGAQVGAQVEGAEVGAEVVGAEVVGAEVVGAEVAATPTKRTRWTVTLPPSKRTRTPCTS